MMNKFRWERIEVRRKFLVSRVVRTERREPLERSHRGDGTG